MRFAHLTWLGLSIGVALLPAADEQRLALVQKAQADFDRVQLSSAPQLTDAYQCVQTQAAMLAIATPEELPVVEYRKGYCTLVRATINHVSTDFSQAAADFDKAVEAWPGRMQAAAAKKLPVERLPSGLRALAAVAHLEASLDEATVERARKELFGAAANPTCTSALMTVAFCQASVEMGRRWMGWLALRTDDLFEAERNFSNAVGTGWREWVAGRKAFLDRNYREAAAQYQQAIALVPRQEPASFIERLGPPRDVAAELTDLGAAQLLAGDSQAAIATLDAAAKAQPSNARVLFLRARAKELAGQASAALSDYNLASRAAFAGAQDLASGEAHLYRGIMYYRRRDFSHAEDEFASALNFEIPAAFRADAVAWRHLAAVAGGSCEASRQNLQRSLESVSPYFPKEEARQLVAACPATTAGARAAQ